ncbi:hypothetical protein B0H14DRAFT_3422988 [Mycena olivaceomarginata]|nr:hypothetical protein B0H14DRAFT_3422988 [Mycena olivaceomarginata]
MSVLVDDNDPSVLYNSPGGWSRLGQAPEFDGTTHSSVTRGDTATLVFEGTSISLYGTLQASTGQSRLNLSIDGSDVGSYQAPIVPAVNHNQLFWTSPVFEEGSHTLVATVDQDTSLSQITFFIDYFIYKTTSTAGKTVLIDDDDSSVTYSPGGWSLATSDDSLESTKHISTAVGSWAAVSFHGTGISLIGSPSQKDFTASVVIDESPPAIVSQSSKLQLFNSTSLPSGPHTVNITVLTGDPIALDYFLVRSDIAPASTSLGSPTPSGSVQTSSSGTRVASKTPNVAAIYGNALRAVVTIMKLLSPYFLDGVKATINRLPPHVLSSPRYTARPRCFLHRTA